MQFFAPFDLWSPATEDFLWTSKGLAMGIWNRFTDMHTWGLLRNNAYPASMTPIPVSGINPAPPLWPQIAAAPVTLNTQNGLVTVGAGSNSSANPPTSGLVGYDLHGNRIAIENDANFQFGTSGPYGQQSTGNLAIPLTLTGTSGGAGSNPSVPGQYFIWITFLSVNGSYEVTDENGGIHYPEQEDGYQIQITGTPVAPAGDGISLFLAKVTWTGGPAGSLTATTTNVYDASNNAVEVDPPAAGNPGRVWMASRPQYIEIVVDINNPPAIYGPGYLGTLADHVNAIGSGTPTPENPHGTTLADIPGAGQEPIAIGNQLASFSDGFVDKNATQNSPAWMGTAAQPFVEQTALLPNATIDPVATAAGITTSPKDRWIRVTCFTDASTPLLQEAFSNGNALLALYPSLRVTNLSSDPSITSNPNSGDGWVGFNHLEDVTGMYLISGAFATLSTNKNVLLLTKTLLPGWPTVTYDLAPGQLAVALVYWNNDQADAYANPNLYVNPNEAPLGSNLVTSVAIDQRDLGLVGPQQLSTALKSDPVVGALANEVFDNLLANSNYLLGNVGFTEVNFSAGNVVGVANFTVAGSGTEPGSPINDPTLISGGPSAITGRRWTLSGGTPGTLNPSYLWQNLANLLPGKIYGLSFWYKASANFNARFQLGLSAGTPGITLVNLITLDGVSTSSPLDYTLRTDGNWHRASFLLQTLANAGTVNPDPAVAKYLVAAFLQGSLSTNGGATLDMTNLQLTAGEWIPGYNPGRQVPSGGIVEFDKLTSCPPGWTEVVSARGALSLGWNPAGGTSMQSVGLLAGTPITNSAQIGQHLHPFEYNSAATTGSGAGGSWVGGNSGSQPQIQDTENAYVPLPTYTVLRCRAI